jgi:hypothetical protein
MEYPKGTPQDLEPIASFYNNRSPKQELRKHGNNTKKEDRVSTISI